MPLNQLRSWIKLYPSARRMSSVRASVVHPFIRSQSARINMARSVCFPLESISSFYEILHGFYERSRSSIIFADRGKSLSTVSQNGNDGAENDGKRHSWVARGLLIFSRGRCARPHVNMRFRDLNQYPNRRCTRMRLSSLLRPR